jgi:cysteine-rich repeat protein
MIDYAEECDDGNNLSGDGCSFDCRLEGWWPPCYPGPCIPTIVCGNAVLEADEMCDDGNVADGDGCSSSCRLEPGIVCPVPGEPCIEVPPEHCGNGVLDAELGEECDDGINAGGYGACDVGCVLGPHCGDGIVQDIYESCDDGNNVDYDGCSAACREEPFIGQ